MEGAQAVDGVGGFGEAVEGEVQLVAVGHGDQQEADGRGAVALEQQVAEGVEVALGLRHLLAFDEQEADVHPVAREGLAGGGFGLGDLVFVVREHEVFAAGVEVEGRRRETSSPWRSTRCASRGGRRRGRCPRMSRRVCGLPEGEVAGGVLLVLVDIDAGAVFDAFEVFLGELAVLGETRDAEVPGAVFGLVGDVFGGELLDERDHLRDVLGGVGDVLRALDAEGVEVFEEGALVTCAVYSPMGRPAAAALRMILSSTSVMFMTWSNGDALLADEAAQDVDVEEGAEVADVAVVVDGGAAAVHAQCGCADGGERSRSCRLRVLKSSIVATCSLFLPQPARGAVQTALA